MRELARRKDFTDSGVFEDRHSILGISVVTESPNLKKHGR